MLLSEKIEGYFDMLAAGLIEEALGKIHELLAQPQLPDDLKFEIAQNFYQYGFIEEAISITQDLIELYPDEVELSLFLSELYIEQGNEDEAISILSEINPAAGDAYLRAILLSAELYVMQGLYEVAEYKIRKALEQFPEEKILHSALGEVFYLQEKYQLAILSYQKGTEVSTYAKLADCYAHLGMFVEAISYYEKATTTESATNVDLLFGYGFVATRLENWNLATEKLKKVVDIDPYYTSVYPILAEAYMKLGERNDALYYLEQGLKYDQTNPYLFYLKAEVLLQADEYQQAKKELQAALELDEGYTLALEALVEISEKEEDWERALDLLTRLLEIVPERKDIYFKMGIIQEELENWSEAEKSYRQALLLDQEDYEILNRLAFLLRDEGKLEEALACWKRSIAIQPEQWEIEELIKQYEMG